METLQVRYFLAVSDPRVWMAAGTGDLNQIRIAGSVTRLEGTIAG
jgi:hypothetical protein